MDALARMQALLRELFQLDTADLDFGIYRLFHLRAEHFTRFIDEQLPRRVNEAFAALTAAELEEARRELEQLRQRCLSDIASDAIDAQGNVNPRYAKLRLCQEYEEKKLALGRVEATEAHKADVFNHLYRFFSRYYENGDFIPKLRRGMREAYAIPYDGQEVCLYWANQGQHYVKTAERLRDYAFVVPTLEGEQRVRFVLTEASVPKDNTKGDTRFFFPRPAQITYDAKTSTVTLPFEYRLPTEEEAERYGKDTQHGIFREAVPLIIKAVPNELVAGVLKEATGEADKEQISHLVQRLRHFARRHTTDYFVHRDLADFLNRELEFYLKDQVLNLADVQGDLPAKLRTIQVIREIGQEIVTFLDQIETVQGRLFEKPKFVLRTDYLCPIQNIPSELWPEILGNQAQRAAWRELFAISGRVTEGFLRAHPTLVIDTQHFNEDFKLRLLASFHDLEAAVGGFLVHGENYQALRWLNGFQRESVS